MIRWRAPIVAGAGFVVGVAGVAEVLGREDVDLAVADALAGLSLLAGGVIIERIPRERTMGWLLLFAGLAWLLPDVVGLAEDIPSELLGFCLFLHRGLLAHAFLTFPSGRARSTSVGVLVATSYMLALVPGLWSGAWTTVTCSVLLVCALAISAGWRRNSIDLGIVTGGLFWFVVATLAVVRGDESAAGSEDAVVLTYDGLVVAVAWAIVVAARASARLSGVTDLVVELGAGQSGGLAGRLSRALDDPLLQVGYWSAATQQFADASGARIDTDVTPGRAATIVRDEEGEPVAALVHDPALLDDPVLHSALQAATSLSVVHARLQAELRATLAFTEESRRRLLRAADSEREQLDLRLQAGAVRTLARLHDVLALTTGTATDRTTCEHIDSSSDTLDRTLEDLERLAHGLNPRRLVDLDLNEALMDLTTRSPVRVRTDLHHVDASPDTRTCLYFVCSEALANVAKHAPAASCRVSLRQRGDLISLTVEDDGPGGVNLGAGTGLTGLADRAETLGGSLSLSSPPGDGTSLTVVIPDGRSSEA